MAIGVLDIAKKILGKDVEDELELEIDASDGCVGEKIIASIINKLKPC